LTNLPDSLTGLLIDAALLCLTLILLTLRGFVTAFAGIVLRASLLRLTLNLLTGWVRAYTACLEEDERAFRRSEFRRHVLWGQYRRLRRKGVQSPEIAVSILGPAVKDMPGDAWEAVESLGLEAWYGLLNKRGRLERSIRRWRDGWMAGPSDRRRLQQALTHLATDYGYFVTTDRKKLACCSNCGSTDVPDDAPGAVFWNIQGDGYAFDGDGGYCEDDCSDWLQHALYLQWTGDPQLIIHTLRVAGFEVRWEGLDSRAIGVLPSPRHADATCMNPDCRPLPPSRRRSRRATASRSRTRANAKLTPAS
jgi:hypothetical protein